MMSRCVYGLCAIATALLAGCAQSSSPSFGVPSGPGVSAPSAVTEKVVYSFAGGKDGSFPQGAPVFVGSMLYGTTVLGGDAGCAYVHGCGTVYAIDSSGNELVLHAFRSGSDGEAPNGPLLSLHGNLYGTTVLGGNAACKTGHVEGCGTIFEIRANGATRILYRFPGGKGGAQPASGLISYRNELYGEAAAGGSGNCDYGDISGCGVLFKLQPFQKPQILFAFAGGKGGGSPHGGLTMLAGNLYGTGTSGGGAACLSSSGCGTAFRVTSGGTLTTLHAFGRSVHAAALPASGLVRLNDDFYGTTSVGGAHDCALTGSFIGCGTIFRLSPSGSFRQLYSFTGTDGSYPNGLIAVHGTLYGTAESNYSCGFIFSMSPGGRVTALYAFEGGSDGCGPTSALTYRNGTFYGTTGSGGAHGHGTVFAFTP